MIIYYFAYGTNINKKIFLKKFKNAKLVKKFNLKNVEIVFRSKYRVPDLKKKLGSYVQGLIYIIQEDNIIKVRLKPKQVTLLLLQYLISN